MLAFAFSVVAIIPFTNSGPAVRLDERRRITPSNDSFVFATYERPAGRNMPIGYVGKIRIVSETGPFVTSPTRSTEPYFPQGGSVNALFEPDGLGLPGPSVYVNPFPEKPLWRHTIERTSIDRIEKPTAFEHPPNRQAVLSLADPLWPAGVYGRIDSVVVTGKLCLDTTGAVRFLLESLDYRQLGFEESIRSAMAVSRCVPATNSNGVLIATVIPYRCIFRPGAQSSLSRLQSVTVGTKRN